MGRMACTEPQCLYKGDLYLFLCAQSLFMVVMLLGTNSEYFYLCSIKELGYVMEEQSVFCEV